jgi:hypothetical protein
MEEMSLGYFYRAGGFGMHQVALFALVVLVAAGRFAYQPDERKVPFLRTMSAATLLAIAFAVTSNVATVFWSVPKHVPDQASWPRILLIGLFESLTPAVLGVGLLSIAWLVKAVGMRRLVQRLP